MGGAPVGLAGAMTGDIEHQPNAPAGIACLRRVGGLADPALCARQADPQGIHIWVINEPDR